MEFLVYVEMATQAYLENQDSLVRWLKFTAYVSDYLLSIESETLYVIVERREA